ncbi:M1 family metallopeptidase [Pedobacter antarcticus]|uniref:M1 family metallopeptidase n=1 Tax=Pedobacter antarcticus TaxID=34086 RepID=UPI00292F3473|nr:M1 family metallopeptidase [Pedobacter antarcticus]
MKLRFPLALSALICACSLISSAQNVTEITRFTRADTLRGTLTHLRSCYDVKFYHLDVKFNIADRFINGSNRFKFAAVSDFNRLQFDLFENLAVDSIIYRSGQLSFTREANAVFVSFPKNIKKGSNDEFTVFYSGHPTVTKRAPRDDGVVFSTDAAGKPFVATACEGTGASIWWPNKDHLSDEVDSMLISISVPTGLKNVSNGRLQQITDLKNGYTRFDWLVANPINNYNVAANIGDYTHFSDTYKGESGLLSLDYWVLPENKDQAVPQFKKSVPQMLAAFEYWFGPYPFYNDGYKLIDAPYPAMEHQGAIGYGGFLKGFPPNEMKAVGGKEVWDFIIVHESAHEWFGNNITAQDLADLWIHESFGTYAESLFIEYLYGKQAGQDYVAQNRAHIKNESAIVAPYYMNKMGSGEMYGKGSVLLNMVRTIINDDLKWRTILRGLNTQFRHQTVTYADIVNYISSQSGKKLNTIFDQYLLFKDIPKLELSTVNGELNCRWLADVKDFNMPVRVKVKDAEYQWIYPSSKFKPLGISGATKDNVEIDTANFFVNVEVR